MAVIGRIDRPDGRHYAHPTGDGRQYDSVTTILAATKSKPWLEAWAAKKAAKLLLANMGAIKALHDEQGYGAALLWVKDAAKRDRDVKADLGTHVHNIIEALILGVALPDLPDHLAGIVIDDYSDDENADPVEITTDWVSLIADGFLAFSEDFDVDYEMAEATVAHPDYEFAGTLDIIGVLKALRVPQARFLIDAKTGKKVDPDVGEQLAAYRRCREVWIDLGNIEKMPQVHGAAVLHLRTHYRRGYKLLHQAADVAAWRRFLLRRDLMARFAEQPNPNGRPLYPALPDGSQPAPMIEDMDVPGFNRARTPLTNAGVDRLDDLVVFTAAELLQVQGIGVKTLDSIKAVLADRGLSLAEASTDTAAAVAGAVAGPVAGPVAGAVA